MLQSFQSEQSESIPFGAGAEELCDDPHPVAQQVLAAAAAVVLLSHPAAVPAAAFHSPANDGGGLFSQLTSSLGCSRRKAASEAEIPLILWA